MAPFKDRIIRTESLQYDLPQGLIAMQPCTPRDASRLMVVHRETQKIEHCTFRDIVRFLDPSDCLVLNKTRVLPAKLVARRETGGKIGGLFVRELEPGRWHVMLQGARRLKPGERLSLGGDVFLFPVERLERGLFEVRIEPVGDAESLLARVGGPPLPPYIQRDVVDDRDAERYQTVYAGVPGAVAAPTAGLHFTDELLNEIKAKGLSFAEVVLHVGLGTFQPVEVEDLSDHDMHREWYDLPPSTAEMLRGTRSAGGRIVAVGTTSVRVLETCGTAGPESGSGWTDLLICPPFAFHNTDVLLTNFHLPGSTLIALVMAFAGQELVRTAYQTAIRQEYRFYSYGDAMLIV